MTHADASTRNRSAELAISRWEDDGGISLKEHDLKQAKLTAVAKNRLYAGLMCPDIIRILKTSNDTTKRQGLLEDA